MVCDALPLGRLVAALAGRGPVPRSGRLSLVVAGLAVGLLCRSGAVQAQNRLSTFDLQCIAKAKGSLLVMAHFTNGTMRTSVNAWFLVSTDGDTTYPDGDASTTPAWPPDMIFPLRAVSTAQVVPFLVRQMPLGSFKVLIRNDGTGATMNTTWSLKCRTYTLQSN